MSLGNAHHECDGVADELGVLLDHFLDLLLLDVLRLVLLEVELDIRPAADALTIIMADGEGATSRRLPHILLIIVVLGGGRKEVQLMNMLTVCFNQQAKTIVGVTLHWT